MPSPPTPAGGRPPTRWPRRSIRCCTSSPRTRAGLAAAIDARERELEEPPPANDRGPRGAPRGGERHDHARRARDPGQRATRPRRTSGGGSASRLVSPICCAPWKRICAAAGCRCRRPCSRLTASRADPLPQPGAALAPAVAHARRARPLHLAAARTQRRAVPRAAQAALLPGTLAGAWLRRLRRAGHDPRAAAVRQRSPFAPLGLLWRHAASRF